MFFEPERFKEAPSLKDTRTNHPDPDTAIAIKRYRGDTLSEQQLNALAKELLGAYAGGFMHSESAVASRADEFLEDLRNHLRSSERIVVAEHGERRAVLCGSVVSCEAGKIYALGGLLIEPGLQQRGLGSELLQQELLETGAHYLSFHTQSRIMEGLGRKYADITPLSSRLIAGYLPLHHANLDYSTCIDHGRYGGKALYGDLDRLKTIAVPVLDLAKGDAQFFAGKVLSINGGIAL
ncbi:MAG: hypothetical protein EBZ48_05825 [Proteobacteria bacterium]|nr:hypothetical protein [Pseudomonadota bacterium]